MEKPKIVHNFFKIVVTLKFIHAIIELLLGTALLLLTHKFISEIIVILVKERFVGDPDFFISQYISQFGIDFSLSIKLFFAVYLIIHGLVNISMVYGVIKKPSLAYPISLIVFIGFLIYQIYDYIFTGSLWMLGIIIFDILFIILLFYEYGVHLKTHSFLGKLKLIARARVPRIVELNYPLIKMTNIIHILPKKSLDDCVT
ncbi:hypothetical protein COU54_03830 [Candidatus Pacearchaeota archaeon CG10_big_fil_rev_8_21_14_0_10_31_24]|nr:MAG: hypothetical protein COU54_03830 [Candidatus Pacearchaeota archaeon CG10_big_fil_rev_8_21_14_0_10_31_24]